MKNKRGKSFGHQAAAAAISLMFAAMPFAAQAQEWHDAASFPLYGKAADSTLTRYERLPASCQGISREPLWYLGRNSAGLAVRFRSDSPYIRAKWTSMFGNTMNHMTETGVRGLDLYILQDGEWRFAGSGRPTEMTTDALLVGGMSREEREYMLYLSLYDGVTSLAIGIDESSSIESPAVDNPSRERPVVMYGTSILQGGCASRPGMAHTNILGRMLGREVINLGFSGNAFLDLEIARLMASVEAPGAFVLDYVPNASAELIGEKGEEFFRILRDAHPDVPVIFVEDPEFPHSAFDMGIRNEVTKKNAAQKALFGKLKADGEKNIYYVSSKGMIGDDGEATVDGIHFTDLGMRRYAEYLYPVLESALEQDEEEYDVIIAGGSTSGTSAAIQAARSGAKVLLVEEYGWLGGMLTSAGVSATDGSYKIRGGIWDEFRDSLETHYGGTDALKTGWVSHVMFEPSVGQRIFSNMAAKEKNLEIRFGTTVSALNHGENGWTVTLDGGDSVTEAKGRILVDATELGDIAKMAGIPYSVGMDSRTETGEPCAPEKANGIVQDMTYVMILKEYDHPVPIPEPDNYEPSEFECCCRSTLCPDCPFDWSPEYMMEYGKLPNRKYMINWPLHGNDFYCNIVEMSREQRDSVLNEAKQKSLRFLYFLQNELGFKHIGLADDEYPTYDAFPFYPYHRESRRIDGMVKFTLNDILEPFADGKTLYRTAVAAGDYPVDQHHNSYSGAEPFPPLHFPKIPSYGLPLGVMIPEGTDDMLVIEKSISVTNIVNGTTRLQPVVLQVGQAAGVLAAAAARSGCTPADVSVRTVQQELLSDGAYLIPLLDVTPDSPIFESLQKVALTGILKWRGQCGDWENGSWFDADMPMKKSELHEGLSGFYAGHALSDESPAKGTADVKYVAELCSEITGKAPETIENEIIALLSEVYSKEYTKKTRLTKGECAVTIDKVLNPFGSFDVDMNGKLQHGQI